MTPTEIKALKLLNEKGRLKATQFAEFMGWGRNPQGSAMAGAGYLARLAKKVGSFRSASSLIAA